MELLPLERCYQGVDHFLYHENVLPMGRDILELVNSMRDLNLRIEFRCRAERDVEILSKFLFRCSRSALGDV